MSQHSHAPSRWRGIVTTGLRASVTIGLIALLLAGTGISHVRHELAHASKAWLTIGLVLGAVAALLQANQWRGLLNAFGVPRSYGRCLRLDTAGRAFDAALPTNIGGDVMRVRLVSSRAELAGAAIAVGLRRVMSLPGLMFLLLVGLAGSWTLPYGGRARAISAACLLGGVALCGLLYAAQRLGSASWLKLPGPVIKIRSTLLEARDRSTGTDQHPFGRAALRGLLFWVMVVLSQGAYIRAVGIHAPIGYTVAVVTSVNALSMLPISIGGYGLREGAFSALLGVGALGTATQGAVVGVCLSAQTLLFGLIGALAYVTLGRNRTPQNSFAENSVTAVPAA